MARVQKSSPALRRTAPRVCPPTESLSNADDSRAYEDINVWVCVDGFGDG